MYESSRLDCQLFQVVHEDLQADVVREEKVAALPRRALRRVVGDRRVELGEEEARLRAILVALDVHGHGEALLRKPVGVGRGGVGVGGLCGCGEVR